MLIDLDQHALSDLALLDLAMGGLALEVMRFTAARRHTRCCSCSEM